MRSALFLRLAAALTLAQSTFASQSYKNASDLSVKTSVGIVNGFIDPSIPTVKKWLGVPWNQEDQDARVMTALCIAQLKDIPKGRTDSLISQYAEPPIGSLRWTPSVAKNHAESIDAFERPPSCQQWLTVLPDLYNVQTPEFLPPTQFSEDCLYLNVITPLITEGRNLPVLVWVHGGMVTWGGINTSYEYPEKWIARSQEHIVVQINYRVNIFGFPNSRALESNNLGLLDIRLSLEWVRSNIAAFGGDPEKITIWGQSAGASLVDALQFTFPSDPIFRSVILESAVVLMAEGGTDSNQTSFTYLAQQMGCPANASASEELECMRHVDAGAIEKFLQNHTDSNESPTLYFDAVADNVTGWLEEEYIIKGETGVEYADVPMLMGSNADEGTNFVPFSVNGTGVTPALLEELTLEVFQCFIAETCTYREASNRTTYRYFYTGNFTNISPSAWEGAYHFSELPLIMGTHNDFRSESTEFEFALSHKMQDLWLAFAKDPYHGLEYQGWSSLTANGTVLVLGKDDVLVQKESVVTIDAGCASI